jgi:Asp-tRNA(Asn)/Glu-tRNA(Gln) amidotransferase C subunit
MFNSRDAAFALVEEGLVSAEQMLTMALSYMSVDDVEEMLDANELSERFREDDEEDEFDGQPDEATEWFDFDPEC